MTTFVTNPTSKQNNRNETIIFIFIADDCCADFDGGGL